MADEQITGLGGLAKLADTELAKQVYSDGLQDGTSELGQIFGELTKTTKMVLQPVLTALQGGSARLNDWVGRAVNNVPEERRVDAKPALLSAVIQAIGTEDDRSQLRDNYVELLASMMDRDRNRDVHPSFPRLLQELSPIDALLLQITPFGSEVDLPCDFEHPPFHFASGLLATWETWKENGHSVGRYRFFQQVAKIRAEAIGKTVVSGKVDDHVGFLELAIAQADLFHDKGLSWQNLVRLGLVNSHDEKDRRGNLEEHYHRDPEALGHIKSLVIDPKMFFGHRMYFRSDLGKAFATCCMPKYTGSSIWHPVDQREKSSEPTLGESHYEQ